MATTHEANESVVPVNMEVLQKKQIKGNVSDELGPLTGVSVFIKGTNTGVITDGDGNFTIDAKMGDKLTFSYIGYENITVEVTSSQLIIKLKEDRLTLDEVVVVGYGTMKKKDLTGAVSSVKLSDIPVMSYSSASQSLAGKVAGLQVNSISAQPGGKVNFNVRGKPSPDGGAGNDPLFIIDGFPVSSQNEAGGGKYNAGPKDNILASINPNDIVSIDVLKDASSTAIYGARAGQGVIIVTTKRGQEGRATVQYQASFSAQIESNSYEVLDATQWRSCAEGYNYEKFLFDKKVYPYGTKQIGEVEAYVPRFTKEQIANPPFNTDWYNEVSRTGFQQQHNLSLSGGTAKTKYYGSLNYFDQKGLLKNNDMQRFAVRFNLDQELNKYFKTGISISLSKNDFNNAAIGGNQNENASLIVAALQANPTLPVRDEDGNYTINPVAAFIPNAVSLLEISDKSVMERIMLNGFLEFSPIKDLVFRLNLGADRQFSKRKTYLPKTTLYGQKENGSATISQNDKYDYLLELTAKYNKTFGKHSLSGLLGYSFQEFNWEGFSASNSDFLVDGFLYNNLGAGAYQKPGVSSTAGLSQMASLFARVGYTYADRYLLTATIRRDGASNFAENNQWGYFPSVALGWRISEESFMENTKNYLSNLKLRLSFGQTGNSNIGNKAYDFYKTGGNYMFGTTNTVGVYLAQLGNKNLKWETTTEYNVGLDIGLFNRVNVTAEIYQRTISDLLTTRSLMSYQEVGSIADNIGKTRSKGFELTINTTNIQNKDFYWGSDITFSLFRDRWEERSPTWKPAAYQSENDYIRGAFSYLSDGLVQPGEEIPHMKGAVPGTVKLKDLDGFQRDSDGKVVYENGKPIRTGKPDGRLDDADVRLIGTWDPSFMFGFNNTFTYKNFDFSIYLYGQANKLMNGSYKDGIVTEAQRFRTDFNFPTSMTEVWSSVNTSATRPGYFQSNSAYGSGDYFYQKTWFVRCRNITLGYTFPQSVLKNVLSNLRIYADINNPFILTNYKGLDPETDQWVNNAPYPNVCTLSFGLSAKF